MTLQNQLLTLCGGRNIFADSPVAWPQVSREQVLVRQPKFIVISGDEKSRQQTREFWAPHLDATIIVLNAD
ncbi:MAG: Vitamin B12-binding protein [Candidatus Erwinia impunctatus]|nr:Vitamin B12-binding protein [Culicoides impunctatus]